MVVPLPAFPRTRIVKRFAGLMLVTGLLAGGFVRGAEVTRPQEIQRLTRQFEAARTEAEAAPSNSVAALTLGRACFELAEFATNAAQRAALAELGIAASHRALALAPSNVAAQCSLGLNLGQLARTRTLSALRLVSQIEEAWREAAALDPKFNHAAPHRLLALLYDAAPGWPISVGSRHESRTNFALAVQLAPAFANNWLCYFEAALGWNDLKTARELAPKTAEAMAHAQERFPGSAWAYELQDWERRWKAALEKLEAAERKARNPTHQQRMKDY